MVAERVEGEMKVLILYLRVISTAFVQEKPLSLSG